MSHNTNNHKGGQKMPYGSHHDGSNSNCGKEAFRMR